MDRPKSTEQLTKLLRSKDVTTSQVYEVASRLDHLELYFPNKEIFVLELLIDRWNDQKMIDYKIDYHMWELFNNMWAAVDDEMIIKKLFKRLKFVPNLIKTLQVMKSNVKQFLRELKRTISLVNSMITVDISPENGTLIVGKLIELMLSVPELKENCDFRTELIREVETLVNLQSIPEISPKISISYCNEMLLPSLKYISKFSGEGYDSTIQYLSEFLGVFIFVHSIDTIHLLEEFVKLHRGQLSEEDTTILFKESISHLYKENFKQLEKVFSIMVTLHPSLSPSLLKELSLSKKTMSQEFLEGLLDNTLSMPTESIEDSSFWQLIFYILDLDIEIGIKNTDKLLDLLTHKRSAHLDWSQKLWAKLVKCHTNARELPQFFDKLKHYCRRNLDTSRFLLTENPFTAIIADCLCNFSISQLSGTISRTVDDIESDSKDMISISILHVILQGLPKLPYTTLGELKEGLRRVFRIKPQEQPILWEVRYLIMEVFDDIIPEEILDSATNEIQTSILDHDSPMELLFYFFKLREYKPFDLTPVINIFMEQFRSITGAKKSQALAVVLNNWCTMINSMFPQEDIEYLVDSIFSDGNVSLLDKLFNDDNIFEEQHLMHYIISRLSQSYDDQAVIGYMQKVPIQSINKNTRVALINNITKKKSLMKPDYKLLVHLLENPTYRSNIENSWASLEAFITLQTDKLTYENEVFETIWKNHLCQMKEAVSENFLRGGITSLSDRLNKKDDNSLCLQMVFLVLKVDTRDDTKELRDTFIEKIIKLISNDDFGQNEDVNVSSWLLRSLYYIIKFRKQEISQRTLLHSVLSSRLKRPYSIIQTMDRDLLASLFLVYTVTYADRLEYLFAHYMVLRELGVEAELIKPGVEDVIRRSVEHDTDAFNNALAVTSKSFENCVPVYSRSILELYQMQIESLSKSNIVGTRLFIRSLSDFYTNSSSFIGTMNGVIEILDCIERLLVSKPWLFSQYCIEILFPMCFKLSLQMIEFNGEGDRIFICATKLVSNIIFTHRVKLSNRHHLVIAFLCEYLELLSRYKVTGLTFKSAQSLSRLLINFCEPSVTPGNHVHNKNSLTSRIGALRNSLRKHVPVLLIKYIHLSIVSPFDPKSKKELANAMYSVFDLLSHEELGLVNATLDNAGRQYLKGLYADYKKFGKWHAD